MDIDTTLDEIRVVTARIDDSTDNGGTPDINDVDRLVELTQSLDGWLSSGGFLPAAWAPALTTTVGRNVSEALGNSDDEPLRPLSERLYGLND